MTAETMKTFPLTGSLNTEISDYEETRPIFTDMVNDLKKLVNKHHDIGMLPLECQYLNKSALISVVSDSLLSCWRIFEWNFCVFRLDNNQAPQNILRWRRNPKVLHCELSCYKSVRMPSRHSRSHQLRQCLYDQEGCHAKWLTQLRCVEYLRECRQAVFGLHRHR